MTQPTTADAKARRRVLVTRPGRPAAICTLIHWPIPVGERQHDRRRGPHKRAGSKATVLLPNSSRISVEPEYVTLIEEGPTP